jgi:hypothetical protein
LLDPQHIRNEFDRLAVLVDKTGSHQEHRAFAFLQRFVLDAMGKLPASATERANQ